MRQVQGFKVGVDGEVYRLTGHIVRLLKVTWQPKVGMTLWAEVDELAEMSELEIVAMPTQWDINDNLAYLDSAMDGNLDIWHYYWGYAGSILAPLPEEPAELVEEEQVRLADQAIVDGLTEMAQCIPEEEVAIVES